MATSIGFIPSWHLDETLYSWAARFHAIHGNGSARETGALLFDAEHACRERDAPRNLHHFVNVTGGTLGNVHDLLRERTAIGLYLPFLSPSMLAAVKEKINCGKGIGWRAQFGMAASSLDSASQLRYCTTCIDEDRSNLGLSRWRVSHQWLGSWVCAEHGRPLCKVSPKRSAWELPTLCSQSMPPPSVSEAELMALIHLSKLAEHVARSEALDMDSVRQLALNGFREQGVTSWSHPVDRMQLARWFKSMPIVTWLARSQGPENKLAGGEWIHDLLRDRRVDHPLKWLVLWHALFSHEDQLSTVRRLQTPVSQPHWDASGQGRIWGTALDKLPADVNELLTGVTTVVQAAEQLGTTLLSLRKRLKQSGTTLKLLRSEQSLDERFNRSKVSIQIYMDENPLCTRTDVFLHCKTPYEWLRKHRPKELLLLMAKVPHRRSRQIALFI
ncbi:TniQ family protein [Aquabacterium sp.]|uniref:TniQ family protein n=1 Tax=Aquabacterium sp. TaxID=1872578 RepID=UPI003D6CEF71